MPKLEGIEESYLNGVRIDKSNADCIFNDDTHTYYDKSDMSKYISVTTLIHSYQNTFDEDFWTSYKALEAILDLDTWLTVKKVLLSTKKFNSKLIQKLGVDEELFLTKKQELIDEYDRKRKESTDRGTAIHAEFEHSFYNRSKFDFNKYGFKDLVGDFECKKDYYTLDLENGVYPEFLISVKSRDGLLKVAGQIDLLIVKGNDVFILDFKTNKSIDKHSYYNKSTKKHEMLKFPLNNLEDCNYFVYSLQLSTYAYMLQQLNPNYNIKGLMIYHVDHDNKHHQIPVEYLKDDVERMLKHYKRESIKKDAYDSLKPVIV